jgi:hypothetical protein
MRANRDGLASVSLGSTKAIGLRFVEDGRLTTYRKPVAQACGG